MRSPTLCWMLLFCPSFLLLGDQPVSTTLCTIMEKPEHFDGKMVKVRAEVLVGFEHCVLSDPSCSRSIWLSFDQGPHIATAMEYAPIESWIDQLFDFWLRWTPLPHRPPMTVRIDGEMKRLLAYLRAKHVDRTSGRRCATCPLFATSATFVGRLDVSPRRYGACRYRNGSILHTYCGGFGHLNKWNVQLAVESAVDVSARTIDPIVYERTR